MTRRCVFLVVACLIAPLMLDAGAALADEVKVYRDVPTPEEVTTILNRPLRMRGIEFPKVQPPQASPATPAAATSAAPSTEVSAPSTTATAAGSPVASAAGTGEAVQAATGVKSETARAIAFHLNFAFNSAEIAPDANPYLDAVGTALKSEQLANAVIVVEGHTDAVGSDAYNQLLSQRRAERVRQYLIDKFDVNPRKLIAVGKGKAELLDPDLPYSGVNRRVQFHRAE